MRTEDQVIADFQAVLRGERQRLKKALEAHQKQGTLTKRVIVEETYQARVILGYVSKNANQLVDEWVDSALAASLQ